MSYGVDEISGEAFRWTIDVDGSFRYRLGPKILSVFCMKGQVLHRERVFLKFPVWLSDFTALLTSKLPMLLSRLKDTSGGSEIIWLVSGSFCIILKFLTERLYGWWVRVRVRVNGIRRFFCFICHLCGSTVSRLITRAWCLLVLTTESGWPY